MSRWLTVHHPVALPELKCQVCGGTGFLELASLPDGRWACPCCRAELARRGELQAEPITGEGRAPRDVRHAGKLARQAGYWRAHGCHDVAERLEAELVAAERCRRCGRALTDPESVSRGIGPDCVSKEADR